MDIEPDRTVYLFLHGRMDLREQALSALESAGISRDAVTDARPDQTGQKGDYMAMLWMPPKPDHIRMQRITEVVPVEPQGMIGLWKGVTAEDISKIPL